MDLSMASNTKFLTQLTNNHSSPFDGHAPYDHAHGSKSG